MNAADFSRDLAEAMDIAGPSSPVRVVVNGDECHVEAVGHARGMVIVEIYHDPTARDPDELESEIDSKDAEIAALESWVAEMIKTVESLVEFMDDGNELVKKARELIANEP